MSKTRSTQDRMTAVGGAALTGWRGTAAHAVARPVARHSRFTEDQVKAFLGFLVITYAIYRIVKPLLAAGRRSSSDRASAWT